jgi:hypothetical protein
LKGEKIYLNQHEIKQLKKIRSEKTIIEFNPNSIMYKKPKNTPENCLEKKKNYELTTYIRVKISINKKKISE